MKDDETPFLCRDCNEPMVVESANHLMGVVTTNWYICPKCNEKEKVDE